MRIAGERFVLFGADAVAAGGGHASRWRGGGRFRCGGQVCGRPVVGTGWGDGRITATYLHARTSRAGKASWSAIGTPGARSCTPFPAARPGWSRSVVDGGPLRRSGAAALDCAAVPVARNG